MNPMGKYQSFDMLDAYDYWHDIRGMFTNPDGSQSFEVGFGFAMWGTDGDTYTNAQAEANGEYWSGLYFDDITMRGELVGEEVWRGTVIVPGPMEPCDFEEVQWEWEDVPYCNYKITIKCEQGCQNCGIAEIYEQILVVSDKERMHYKEVESHDYTGIGEGEWGISSSDYDNYLASNPNSVLYDSYMSAIAQLAPDHGGNCGLDPGEPACIDISHLLPLAPGDLLMDFEAWWDIEGSYPDFGVMWDYCTLEVATGCPADTVLDWNQVIFFGDLFWNGPGMGRFPESSYIYTGLGNEEASDGWVTMTGLEDGSLGWLNEISWWLGLPVFNDHIDLGMILTALDPTVTEFSLRFKFVSDSGFNFRGIKLDDILITNMIYDDDVFPPATVDFFDTCDNMDNWCLDFDHYGQWWEYIAIDSMWCTEFPPLPVVDGLIWTTEIADCFEAYLSVEMAWDFDPGAQGLVQVREVGGEWFTLDVLTGASGAGIFPDDFWETRHYNLNFWVGKDIQIQFLAQGAMGAGGRWCIGQALITGKQDHTPPVTTLTMSGTMADAGWYSSAVQCEITAVDDVAMGEIHYILDGVHKVVPGDRASFTVTENGAHNLEYWGVDAIGNEEVHHIVPTFRIDAGAPPTVAITAPTPGLYLFGNKLLSSSKVFIIGAFNIEATASDAESGIYRVQFYLDGDIIAEDTEVPYNAYCAVKHMGAGTIKAVAEDFSGNTAEDTLDVTYYKFL
jgi:hypothetical protein